MVSEFLGHTCGLFPLSLPTESPRTSSHAHPFVSSFLFLEVLTPVDLCPRRNHLLTQVCVCVCSVTQLCLTLCDPMDCSLPGSSVHGIFQARILEWVAISSFQRIFPTQGWNPYLLPLLHWQADSLPPAPPGKPKFASSHFSKPKQNSAEDVLLCPLSKQAYICTWFQIEQPDTLSGTVTH